MQVHYRKGTKTMFIQAFDGNKYCCVNDTDIYTPDCIPAHEAKSRDLDLDYKGKSAFGKFVRKQEHHWNDEEKEYA